MIKIFDYIKLCLPKPSIAMYTICLSLVIVLAFWLVYKSTQDFLNSAVTSTIDSIDVPLSEMYFPSVTVCNINQVGLCNTSYRYA